MNDIDRLIRHQQAVLIGLQANRIAQLEEQLAEARKALAARKVKEAARSAETKASC